MDRATLAPVAMTIISVSFFNSWIRGRAAAAPSSKARPAARTYSEEVPSLRGPARLLSTPRARARAQPCTPMTPLCTDCDPATHRVQAAVRIQAFIRCLLAQWRYARAIGAIVLIQAAMRGALARLTRRAAEQRRAEAERAAASRIQRFFSRIKAAAASRAAAPEPAPAPAPAPAARRALAPLGPRPALAPRGASNTDNQAAPRPGKAKSKNKGNKSLTKHAAAAPAAASQPLLAGSAVSTLFSPAVPTPTEAAGSGDASVEQAMVIVPHTSILEASTPPIDTVAARDASIPAKATPSAAEVAEVAEVAEPTASAAEPAPAPFATPVGVPLASTDLSTSSSTPRTPSLGLSPRSARRARLGVGCLSTALALSWICCAAIGLGAASLAMRSTSSAFSTNLLATMPTAATFYASTAARHAQLSVEPSTRHTEASREPTDIGAIWAELKARAAAPTTQLALVTVAIAPVPNVAPARAKPTQHEAAPEAAPPAATPTATRAAATRPAGASTQALPTPTPVAPVPTVKPHPSATHETIREAPALSSRGMRAPRRSPTAFSDLGAEAIPTRSAPPQPKPARRKARPAARPLTQLAGLSLAAAKLSAQQLPQLAKRAASWAADRSRALRGPRQSAALRKAHQMVAPLYPAFGAATLLALVSRAPLLPALLASAILAAVAEHKVKMAMRKDEVGGAGAQPPTFVSRILARVA